MNTNCGMVITGSGWVLPHSDRPALATRAPVADSYEALNTQIGELISGSRLVGDALPTGYRAVPEDWLEDHEHLPKELKRDKGSWITAIAIERALRQAALDRSTVDAERIGLVLGSSLAGQLGMIQFASEVREQSPRFVSPINFPQTVGNYIAGAIARAMDLRGPNSTLAGGCTSGLDAVIEACELLASNRADVMLAGATEVLTDATAKAFRRGSASLIEGAVWIVLERAGREGGGAVIGELQNWSRSAAVGPALSPTDPSWGSLIGPLAILTSLAKARGIELPGASLSISPQPSATNSASVSFDIGAGNADAGRSRVTLIVPAP